jgi:general secretion pathway protein F
VAVYEWRGLNPAGREVKGVRDADNPKVLRGLLKRDGILLTSALEESAAKKANARNVDFGRYFRRVSVLDVAMMTRQFATLL